MKATPPILICVVNYRTEERTAEYLTQILSSTDRDRFKILIADNSPQESERLRTMAVDIGEDHARYWHFPTNPGYAGGARLALSRLVAEQGAVSAKAVVLSNVDLDYEPADLAALIDEATLKDPTGNWILAPDIVEDGRNYRANPHVVERQGRPSRIRNAARHFYPTSAAYLRLYDYRRATRQNETANQLEQWSTMHAPHGAMIIFGTGYFRRGGSLPEAPLFEEELAVADMAESIECPVYFAPSLLVRHEIGVTTSAFIGRDAHTIRRKALSFYKEWAPSYSLGLMANWFL